MTWKAGINIEHDSDIIELAREFMEELETRRMSDGNLEFSEIRDPGNAHDLTQALDPCSDGFRSLAMGPRNVETSGTCLVESLVSMALERGSLFWRSGRFLGVADGELGLVFS